MGTITKALELLNFFSRTRPEIALGEFVRLTGRDKATVYRHLVELEQNGFIARHPATRAYGLGPAILRLAAVREITHPVHATLLPVVERLAREVGELAHASLLQGKRLTPVAFSDPRVHGTQVAFDEAELLPLHATSSGLAVLAFAEPGFVDRVLRGGLPVFASGTITEPDRLRGVLSEIRKTGLSHLAQGFDDEVASQGAPLFGPTGLVAGALSVAVPTIRSGPGRLEAMRPALRAAALAATRALGGTVPQDFAALAVDGNAESASIPEPIRGPS